MYMIKTRPRSKPTKSKPTKFGKRLRQRRQELGLSVSQLSQRAGLTEWTIRQMEYGETKAVTMPRGLDLAKALDVSPYWLAGLDHHDQVVGATGKP